MIRTNDGTQSRRRMIRVVIVALLLSTSLVFVIGVYDGTFPRPHMLYALTIAAMAIASSEAMRRGRIEITLHPVHVVFFVYLLAGAVSIFNAVNVRLSLESVAQLACYFVVCYFSTASLSERLLSNVIAAVTALASAIALAYHVLPQSSELHEIFQQLSRGSTFGNPTYFAGFLVLALPFISSQALEVDTRQVRRLLYGLLTIVGLYLLVRTESRSAWGAFVISAVVFGALQFRTTRSRWIAVFCGMAATVVLIVLFDDVIFRRLGNLFDLSSQSSISRRMFFYAGAWKAFLASPVIGNGIGNFVVFLPKFRSPEYWMVKSEDIVPHAHNEYLEILSETGLTGLLLFGILLFMVFRNLVHIFRQSVRPQRTLHAALIASMAGVLLDNMFSLNLRTIPVALAFWVMVGVSLNEGGRTAAMYTLAMPAGFKRLHAIPLVLSVAVAAVMIPDILNRYTSEKEYLAGLLLRFQHQNTGSTEKFRLAVEHNPHFAEAKFYFAAQLTEQGRHAEALEIIKSLRSEHPHYPKAQLMLALSSLALGDTTAATGAIARELSVGNSPEIYLYAAELSRLTHDPEKEYDYLATQLRKNIQSGMDEYAAPSIGRLGELSVQLQKTSGYISLMDSVGMKFSGNAAVLISLGSCYADLGDTGKARWSLGQARAMAGNEPSIIEALKHLEEKIDSARH